MKDRHTAALAPFHLFVMSLVVSLRLSLNSFTCTVKPSCGYSSIRPFNWTVVLVPVHRNQRRMSNYATVDDDIPPFSEFLLDLFSANLLQIPVPWTTLYLCTFRTYLRFMFGTNEMHATLHAYDTLVFFPALFYEFVLFHF